MIGQVHLDALKRAKSSVYGPYGEKIGTLGNIFLDVGSGDADFAIVHLGLFGVLDSIVSLRGATITNGHVHVRFTRDTIKLAPRADLGGGLDEADKAILDRYYEVMDPGPED